MGKISTLKFISLCSVISTMCIFGIYKQLIPLSKEAKLEWMCKEWSAANPIAGNKWEKAKAYKKLQRFTRSSNAYVFCKKEVDDLF